MNRLRAGFASALFSLALAFALGCFGLGERPAPTRTYAPPADEPDGSVKLVSRLLEQPLDDPYFNRKLWSEIQDPLPHATSAILAANGIRVGVISGVPPAELERIASIESSVLSARQLAFPVEIPKAIPIQGPLESATAEVVRKLTEPALTSKWENAACGLQLTAKPQPNGEMRIRFEPVVQYGAKGSWWRANDEGKFDWIHEMPSESFAELAWERTLAPGELLIVGPTRDPAGTLGELIFHTPARHKQRILVLQAGGER